MKLIDLDTNSQKAKATPPSKYQILLPQSSLPKAYCSSTSDLKAELITPPRYQDRPQLARGGGDTRHTEMSMRVL
jgi:hypothetical protein